MPTRKNALDQALDIAGTLNQSQSYALGEEPLQFGPTVSGQSGSSLSIISFSMGLATITGLSGMTASSIGKYLTISGANSAPNNGSFLISEFISASSVKIINSSAVAPDSNNGSISWLEKEPYSLADDINYIRTDRRLIKGTTNWYDPIPTYIRPTATTTSVSANLTNISGKTTDARGFVFSRIFRAAAVTNGNTFVTISSPSNLKHSDSLDKTGIPTIDSTPYLGITEACYVHITDPATDDQIEIVGGPYDGYVLFGLTRKGSSVSPNSVEIELRAVKHGTDISSSVPYTWENYQPSNIDLTYGYFERLDLVDEYAFRKIEVLGVESDADLRQDINNISTVIGPFSSDGYLTGLTNTDAYHPFNSLDSNPTITEALNVLNQEIGNRDYTGSVLTDGETITESLQALANAIAATSGWIRIIERSGSFIPSGTLHVLPGGNSYTIDPSNNGNNMLVFVRGILRDPGTLANGDNYEETDSTHVKFYFNINANDHINYIIKT